MVALLPLLLLAGMASVLGAESVYRPLDGGVIYVGSAVLFILPFFVLIGARRSVGFVWLSRIFAGIAGAVLLLVGGGIYANGAWDTKPPTTINTVVTGKVTSTVNSRRRNSKGARVLRVKSWRAGRDEERLYVDEATFQYAEMRLPLSVQVHPGLFGLTWYDRVLPGR